VGAEHAEAAETVLTPRALRPQSLAFSEESLRELGVLGV
jgi:hypothetical protein